MYIPSHGSTDLLQEVTNQPIFNPTIDLEFKRQPFFEAQDFNQMPVQPRQRVSEKLLENKLRRLQINMQKQQQAESLLEKKKVKEREVYTNICNRLAKANQKKQQNLRQSHSQQQNRRRGDEIETRQKLRRYQANLEKISKGREKAEERKHDYIFRIHRRTEQNLRKARHKRMVMQSMEQAQNDQIHLEEWNTYKEKILRKYEGRERSPPDHLYQEFKERHQKLQRFIVQAQQEPQEKDNEQQRQVVMVSCVSTKSLVGRTKKAEYFGIHEQNVMAKTVREVDKMRRFLQNEGSIATIAHSEEAYGNFKRFFMEEILHG